MILLFQHIVAGDFMDKDTMDYIRKNRPAWESTARKKFLKSAALSLLVLFVAFLAKDTLYGEIMSLALVLGLLTMFVLDPVLKKRRRKNKKYNNELD